MTSQQWSEQAKVYAENVPELTSLHALDLIRSTKVDIERSNTLLDVGCGSGAFAEAYMKVFPKGIPGQTLILTDLSEGMIDKAREALQVLPVGFQTRIQFQIEDGTQLEGIPDDSIDFVVSTFGLFLIPDQNACQQAILRVLKKHTGVFANASWMFQATNLLKPHGFGVSLQDVFETALDTIRPDREPSPIETMWAQDKDIQQVLGEEGYGFHEVKVNHAIHTNVWDFSILWNILLVNPVLNMKEVPPESVAVTRKRVLEFLDQEEFQPLVLWSASNLSIARWTKVD